MANLADIHPRRLVFTVSGIAGRLLLVAALAAVPLVAIVGTLILEMRQNSAEYARQRLETSAEGIAAELVGSVNAARQVVTALSQSTAFYSRAGAPCSNRLRRVGEPFPLYHNLFSTDLSGRLLCSALPLDNATPLMDTDLLLAAQRQDGPVLGDVVPAHSGSGNVLPVAAALRDEQGNVQALVGVTIDLEVMLREALAPHDLPEATFTLWDVGGRVLARLPDPQGMTGENQRDSALYTALQRQTGRVGLIQAPGLDGLPRIYGFQARKVGMHRYWLTVGLPTRQLYGGANAAFLYSAVTLLVVTVLAVLGAWLLGQISLRRPVERLVMTAQALHGGNLEARVGSLSGTPELRDLAQAFDAMAETLSLRERERDQIEQTLAQARDNLEATVAARTAALTESTREAEQRARTIEARHREMNLLAELAEMLQTCTTLEESYPVLQASLDNLFSPLPGRLYLLRDSRNALVPVVHWGQPETAAAPFPPSDCWALRLGRAYFVTRTKPGSHCHHIGRTDGDTYCAPLLAEGGVLGLLTVACPPGQALPNALQDPAMVEEYLLAAAGRAGLALANIKLRMALQQQSIRDPLTQLFNRRYLEEAFRQEVARTDRDQGSFAVLVLDVDHFKRFNDTYGHDAGDEVLRSLAACMTRLFRAEDLLCRYGGEEFVVMLRNTTLDQGRLRAEALCDAVRQLEVRHEGRTLGPVTVSVGVAAYPKPVPQAGRLISTADAALYRAKQTGRDRVVTAAEPPPAKAEAQRPNAATGT